MKGLPSTTSIRDFLRAVASAEGTHGAVSVAAVSGGLGTSLLLMAAALPQTRSDTLQDRTLLAEAAIGLNDVQGQFLETIETDTAVKIFTARNMPQASDAQRAERREAIQLALQAAADVPLEVMRLSTRALTHARDIASHCSRAAAADVELATALLLAAFNGARSNLEGKLTSLTDTHYIKSVIDEVARLSEDVAGATRATSALLQVPPA